jgi:hypothetical protein
VTAAFLIAYRVKAATRSAQSAEATAALVVAAAIAVAACTSERPSVAPESDLTVTAR